MHDLIAKTKEENKAQLKCYAGSAGAVIYDNGALSSCENKAGCVESARLRLGFPGRLENRYDEGTPQRSRCRLLLHARIELFYPSLPFNARHLIKIKKLEKQMKKASEEMGFLTEKEIALKA